VGPPLYGHRAAGALDAVGQGGGQARLGRRRVPTGVWSVAKHDHRGVRVTSACGRAVPPLPHDGDHTIVEPLPHGRPPQRRHAARLRSGHGRRPRRKDDTVAGPATQAVQTSVADRRGSFCETGTAESCGPQAGVYLTAPNDNRVSVTDVDDNEDVLFIVFTVLIFFPITYLINCFYVFHYLNVLKINQRFLAIFRPFFYCYHYIIIPPPPHHTKLKLERFCVILFSKRTFYDVCLL